MKVNSLRDRDQSRGERATTTKADPEPSGEKQGGDVWRGGGPGSQMLFERETPDRMGRGAILAAFHHVPTLNSVLTLKAKAVAEVPFHVERDGEVIDDHPVADLLSSPNSEQSAYDYKYLQTLYLELLGETFAVIDSTPEQAGRDTQLLPFPPTSVKRKQSRGSSGEFWRVRHNNLEIEITESDNILWRKLPDLRDPYGRGIGLGRALQDELEITQYAADTEKAAFYNNGRPDFMVQLPGANKNQIDRFREKWQRQLRGVDQTGSGLFLGGAEGQKIQFREVSRSLDDMTVEELRDFSHRVIERVPGVPPELLGRVENSNRATIENAEQIFARWQLKPTLRQMQETFQQQLVPLFGDDDVRVTFPDPEPNASTFALEVAKEFPQAFTVNEIRQLAGETPREGGDIYIRRPAPKRDEVEAGDPLTDGGASTPGTQQKSGDETIDIEIIDGGRSDDKDEPPTVYDDMWGDHGS